MTESHHQRLRASTVRQRLQFLVKDSALYGTAAALSRMLTLLILPVLTRLLSNAEYGALDAMTVLGASYLAFIIMGQDSALARYYYESEDPDERKQIITQAFVIELVLCVGMTALAWFSAELVLAELYGIEQYTDVFRILVLSLPLALLVRFSSNLLRWTFARYEFVIIAFGSSGAIMLITLVFVLGFDQRIEGVYHAQVVGNALFAVLGIWFCRKHFAWPRGLDFARPLLRYGAPYMVVGVATCVLPTLDRVFVTRYLGLDATGVYAIGYRYAFLLMLPVQAFLSAWVPFSLSIYKEPTAEATYNRVLTLFIAGTALLSVAMVAVAEPLIELVASARYLRGSIVVLPILLALVVQTGSFITGIGVDLSKKTHFSMLSYFIGIGASALFIWLLVERLGLLGVGIGVFCGRSVQAIAYTAFAHMVYPLRLKWKRPVVVIGISGLAGALMQLDPGSLALQIPYRAMLVSSLALVIWFAMLAKAERERALAWAGDYARRRSSGGTPPAADNAENAEGQL